MPKCDICQKECKDMRGLAAHRRSHGKKGKRRGPKKANGRRGYNPRRGLTTSQGDSLRFQAKEYREKADRLEAIAEELDSL